MKRVKEYRTLFAAEPKATLKELKTTYRNLVKEWHPDKFQADDEKAAEAEEMGRKIIDAYHFLVSIAPETREKYQEEYTETINNSGIADFQHKGVLLEITFLDGTTYEYFGVPRSVYIKMCQSDKLVRFAKRNVFTSYLYRKSKKSMETV
jgi:DnaJ-class molecular chaperone